MNPDTSKLVVSKDLAFYFETSSGGRALMIDLMDNASRSLMTLSVKESNLNRGLYPKEDKIICHIGKETGAITK